MKISLTLLLSLWSVLAVSTQQSTANSSQHIKCNGEDKCCTSSSKCGEGDGYCNNDNDCKANLQCGTNNCIKINKFLGNDITGFNPKDDCCFDADKSYSNSNREKNLLKKFLKLTEFRTSDGSDNNLKKTNLGKVFTNRIRIAPQRLCNKKFEGRSEGLVSARRISNAIHDIQDVAPATELEGPFNMKATSWMWAWGEFMDHDFASEPSLGEDVKENLVDFCGGQSCRADINVPRYDPVFSKYGVEKLQFFRTGFKLGPNSFKHKKCLERLYPNTITHWIDASVIYGSTPEQVKSLRDLSPLGHGRLKTDDSGKFAPIVTDDAGNENFLFGERRGGENSILISVHVIWVREHNRVADILWKARGEKTCNDACNEDIFQHARAYVNGLLQKITYEEWLPVFLGRRLFRKHIGRYKGYDPTIDPSVSTEFTTAAYRVGHTIVNSVLFRVDENYKTIPEGNTKLTDEFFPSASKFAENSKQINSLMLGLGAHESQATDPFVIDTLRNMLFGKEGAGSDLVSLNIQRGRDNGDERIGKVRKFICKRLNLSRKDCPPITSFEQISSSRRIARRLKRFYKNPEDVELFVAGLTEPLPRGWNMGITFGLIIADQFKRFRDGDRFWYENYLPKQIVAEIKRTTLRDLIIRTLDVKPIQRNVFIPLRRTPPTKCHGGKNCCPSSKCDEGDGNCDTHHDCKENLECGKNNCIQINKFLHRCCYDPTKSYSNLFVNVYAASLTFGFVIISFGVGIYSFRHHNSKNFNLEYEQLL